MNNDEELRDLQKGFYSHESKNEERWKTVFTRLDTLGKRIKAIDEKTDQFDDRLIRIAGTLILFLLGVVATLANKLLGGL